MATYLNVTDGNVHVPPDYFEPGHIGGGLVATSGCMIAFTTVAVALRFLSRYTSTKVSCWWDDWCALVAWVLLIPMFSFLIDSVQNGVGQHQGRLSFDQVWRLNRDIYIAQIFYSVGLTALKFSALFFYIRVFPWTRLWFRGAIYIAFALCTGWGLAVTFLNVFQCVPIDKYWKQDRVGGRCLSGYSVNLGVSIPNVVIDTLILLIPMPFLNELAGGWRQKVGVALVFFAGYATLALSITRVVFTVRLTGSDMTDYSWKAVKFLEVVNLEPGIGLVSVCLPAQVYLFRHILIQICGLHCWSTLSSSFHSKRRTIHEKSKRRSARIKSVLIDHSRWRNLSNATSNTSYSAEVYADLDLIANHTQENIQGIHVQREVTVRPSSWQPQFVTLMLGE